MPRRVSWRSNAEVGCREHVWAAQREHEEHLSGPDADAFDARQVFDHGGVFLFGQRFEDDRARRVCLASSRI